ncbi:aminoglycoside phosphotransferase (APT) family kinase protein [Pseudonocardia eucalypti]|uniref:phosphotransferase family protein n=1 Tax=Pseudonocardia eucalypti TaxID=648755 RepID=UPI00180ED1EC|nr:aminoglycoside phosphotransferase (APT) family kinase protein [Pseudonocardia eucalypti]
MSGLETAVEAVLARTWGHPVTVREARQLAGGASREIWSFLVEGDGARRLVMRRDPEGAFHPMDIDREAGVLVAAHEAGVPVPRPHAFGDGGDEVGRSYVLMDHVDGETIPRRLLRDPEYASARASLAAELGRVLARIHAIPLEKLPDLGDAVDPLDELVAMHEEFGEPRPALEVAFRWLAENRPPAAGPALVHGDFRNGNLMVGPEGLRAVLDWERAKVGDPVEDLGWLCVKAWRFGAPAAVGGFGDRGALLDGYAEVAGWRPSDEALRWWEVFGTANWAVICRRQAERHLSGAERSVEMAVLGRRVCESEHDVLLALGLTEAGPVDDPLESVEPAPADPHDPPSVDGLLAATADFLRAELVDGPAAGADQRVRFHARVAANALAIARRELRVGGAQRAAHAERLAALGCASDAELVAAIRSGSLDGRWPEVLDAVRALTIAKVTVANPRYLAHPGA